MKCFMLSVALYGAETWILRQNEKKTLEAFEMWIWRSMERVNGQTKNAIVLERVGEGKIMLELIRRRKRNWLGYWLRRNCLLNEALEGMVNENKVCSRRIYQMIDNIKINGLFVDMKRKAEKRLECRMLSLQWNTCLWAEHYGWLIDNSLKYCVWVLGLC